MKRFLKWFAVGLGALVVLVVAGGMLMPRTMEVSREIVINTPPEKIYPQVSDLKTFNKWSPWDQMDTAMKLSYSGAETGVVQVSSWQSEKLGNGSQTITELTENEKVVTTLDFGPMGTALARFDLTPEADATRVTWLYKSDLGNNPISRWFGPFPKSGITMDYDTGLATLKSLAEAP